MKIVESTASVDVLLFSRENINIERDIALFVWYVNKKILTTIIFCLNKFQDISVLVFPRKVLEYYLLGTEYVKLYIYSGQCILIKTKFRMDAEM